MKLITKYLFFLVSCFVLSISSVMAETLEGETTRPQTARAERTGPASDPLDRPSLRVSPLRLSPPTDSATAFNPAISLILDGGFYRDNVRGGAFEIMEEADGFSMGHSHGHSHGDDGHSHGALDQGFNLREAELAISATVDPYFDAFAMITFTQDDVELEEAYGVTRSLPAGTQIKFGRFLSDIGYINKHHPHSWLFASRPLMSSLIFGDHGLQENGVQFSWLPPTPHYTRIGFEVLQGETAGVANYEGSRGSLGNTQRGLENASGPRLFTGFAKYAPDLGYSHALQTGLFGGYARKFQNTIEHSTRYEDHDGTAFFVGGDIVYKYDSGKAYGVGNLVLQGEYVYRERDLDRQDTYFAATEDFAIGDVRNISSFKEKQDAFYAQAVYGVAQRFSVGTRLEMAGLTNKTGRGSGESFDDSRRYTANVTFEPTEFSRIRLEYSHGDFAVDGDRERFNSLFLQYILSLGVHGAHLF